MDGVKQEQSGPVRGGSDGGDHPNARRRLPRSQRERLIVTEAIRFFAEVGLEGQTRELAHRLGVTQPLLYRYFPDKDALIDRVFREVFLDGWDSGWTRGLMDRSVPLVERVAGFYRAYGRANFSYERMRLFIFAGLKGSGIASRYMLHLRDHLFEPLCREIRAHCGRESDAPPTAMEIELVASLHGAVGYVGLRRWVFGSDPGSDDMAVVEQVVRAGVAGLVSAFSSTGGRP